MIGHETIVANHGIYGIAIGNTRSGLKIRYNA
jgi:hypothetical protein